MGEFVTSDTRNAREQLESAEWLLDNGDHTPEDLARAQARALLGVGHALLDLCESGLIVFQREG